MLARKTKSISKELLIELLNKADEKSFEKKILRYELDYPLFLKMFRLAACNDNMTAVTRLCKIDSLGLVDYNFKFADYSYGMIDYLASSETLLPPLHYAAMHNSVGAVKALLSYGYHINANYGEERFTPLHIAGGIEVVNCLIDAGADIEANADGYYSTPFFHAAVSGRQHIVRALYSRGAKVSHIRSYARGERNELSEVAQKLKYGNYSTNFAIIIQLLCQYGCYPLCWNSNVSDIAFTAICTKYAGWCDNSFNDCKAQAVRQLFTHTVKSIINDIDPKILCSNSIQHAAADLTALLNFSTKYQAFHRSVKNKFVDFYFTYLDKGEQWMYICAPNLLSLRLVSKDFLYSTYSEKLGFPQEITERIVSEIIGLPIATLAMRNYQGQQPQDKQISYAHS